MIRRFKHSWLLLLLISICLNAHAQKRNDLIMADDHLILLLDLHSPDHTLDSLLKAAGSENINIKSLKKGHYSALQKQGWNVLPMAGNLLRIDRSLSDITSGKEFMVTSSLPHTENRAGYPADVLYGVNNFARITVHELPNGLTRFFMPGSLRAKRVMLSGSFNNWSTIQGLMAKTDSGWVKDILLQPGVYAYKYIVDGQWRTDVNNNLVRGDGLGNANSIYYRYNFSFRLNGFTDAHRVVVAGSFNKWNEGQLIMNNTGDGWELNLYLHDGMHLYRFLVDGNAVTDPANKATHKDASGTQNSVLQLGERLTFKLNGYGNAHQVYLAGNFNKWVPNNLPMKKVGDAWVLPYTFVAGNYQYKFVVDGNWMRDPENPFTAKEGGIINSFVAVKPNHTFRLKGHEDARHVYLTGNFNGWDKTGYAMAREGDEWVISVNLKPGKCLYKFIVDKQWIIDPGNKLWEQNSYGTGNSVFWIEN